MDRKQIENRDQELVRKFRSAVKGKQKEKLRKNKTLKWLGASALICFAALLFIFMRPSWERRGSSARIAVNKYGIHIEKKNSEAEKSPQTLNIKNKKTGTEAYHKKTSAPQAKAQPVKKHVITQKKQKLTSKNEAQAKLLQKKGQATEAASRKQVVKGIRIARVVTCTGVSNRQFVSPKRVFSMARDKKPVVWMEVYSEKQKLPYTLKHVYFVNGRRYCTVPLKIRYPRMRTWSRITLRHAYQVGQWRVDVVDDRETVLASLKFRVRP